MKKKERIRRLLAFMLAFAMIFTTAFTNISANSGFSAPEGTDAASGVFGDGGGASSSGGIDGGNLFGDGGETVESEPTKTVTLSGSVTYAAEDQAGLALTNILVCVYAVNGEERTLTGKFLTDEEGTFKAENLAAGNYTLEYIDESESFDPAQFALNQAAEDAGYTVKGVPADTEAEYFAAIENVSVQESREINLSLTQNAQITVDEENSDLVEMEVTEEPDKTTEDKKEETTEETGDETSADAAEETGDETASDSTEETGSEENTETPADKSEEGEKTETPAETTPETPAASKIIEVITDEVNLRTTPSVEEENIFAMVNTGAAFEVVEEVTAEDGLWYKVVYEGTEVYIRSDLVQVKETAETPSEETPEETPAEEKMIELTADEVNIRTAPSAEAEIITVLPIGTRFVLLEEITAEDGTIWYKVRYEDGEAYVSSELAAIVVDGEKEAVEVGYNEATTCQVQITDENGETQETIIAEIPQGAFPAEASAITMEANYPDSEIMDTICAQIESALGENQVVLDGCFYNITFLVNGERMEPQKKIAISIQGSGLIIDEIADTNVVYCSPENPMEVNSIVQRDELIEQLMAEGQSEEAAAEKAEEYFTSDITVDEEGMAEVIQAEGTNSGVYGCYVISTVADSDNDYNTWTVEELYQLLSNLSDDALYMSIWDSLSEDKQMELLDYITQVTSGDTVSYNTADYIVNNTSAASLVTGTPILAKKNLRRMAARTFSVAKSETNSAFNKKVDNVADGLVRNKELVEYDSTTGKGKLKLEAYVTGNVTSTEKTVPVDVVLVIDQSGSMDDNFGTSEYIVQDYKNDVAHNTISSGTTIYMYYENAYVPVEINRETLSEQKTYIDERVTFKNIYDNRNKYYYYYDLNGERKQISITRSRSGWNSYVYSIQIDGITIATGDANDHIASKMNEGYTSQIYTVSVEYNYIYKLNDGTEIGTSIGVNGDPPRTLYIKKSGTVSNLEALQTAASNFIDSVRDNAVATGADHRVAVVGFASGTHDGDGSNTKYQNTELFIGTTQIQYESISNANYQSAFQNVKTSGGYNNLKGSISSLDANGATWPEYGFDIANNIFANNAISDSDGDGNLDRNRVIVFFSDGEPGNRDGDRPDNAYNDAIINAKASKTNYGATVYSIGIFSGANSNVISNNSNPIPSATDRANLFMHYVSSNYPNASSESSPGAIASLTLKDSSDITKGYNSYYLSAGDANALNEVFKSISEQIGSPKIELDETTVLQDVMSEYFDVDTSSGAVITAYTMTTEDNGATWSRDDDSSNLSVDTSVTGRVKVSGFDYSENYVANGHTGKKLVVEIPIQYDMNASFGGNDIPTNDAVSGIYDSMGDDCYANFQQPLTNNPINYQIASESQTIYLTNAADLSTLLQYVKDAEENYIYKPDGIKNAFVEIVYTLKGTDSNGNSIELGTLTIPKGTSADAVQWVWTEGVSQNPNNLTDCTEYTLECTVTPNEGSASNKGILAVTTEWKDGDDDSSHNSEKPWIHILKPEVQVQDTIIFLGDEANTSDNIITETEDNPRNWSDSETSHTGIPPVSGNKPELTVTPVYKAGTELPTDDNPYKPEKDTDFGVEVKVGDTDITSYTVITPTILEHNSNCISNLESDTSTEIEHNFTIHVIAGSIAITKRLEEASTEKQEFEFIIKQGDVEYKRVKVEVPAGSTESSMTVPGFPRGTYTVTENVTSGYGVQNITIGSDTNCIYSVDTETEIATFTMGSYLVAPEDPDSVEKTEQIADTIETATYDKGIFGSAIFVNGKVLAQNWGIVKCSKTNNELTLPGAQFELTIDQKTYYGQSVSGGAIEWYQNKTEVDGTVSFSGKVDKLPKGTYTLTETKAPTGYMLSEATWQIQIAKGGALKAISIVGSQSTIPSKTVKGDDGKTVIYYCYENEALYDLPSSGGPGIFWSLIGGVLLMMAAALIIYKNKCREVLRG